jgi:transcriptional regulator GlxA family with amidase domain
VKHLTIIIPEGQNNLSGIVGTYKLLKKANEYWQKQGHSQMFEIQLADISNEAKFHDDIFSVRPHTNIGKIKKTDLIIIPALRKGSMAQNKKFIPWMIKQYEGGAELASIFTGTFLLASAGLLNGKSCAIYGVAVEEFRKMFPRIKLVTDKIITEENGIYTYGGAFSYLNLILYLVEKYYDRKTALFCSKLFDIEVDSNSRSSYTMFLGQKTHNDKAVKKAQQMIENSINEKVSVEKMASMLALSRRNFDRRFIKATGNTPIEYSQRVKVEFAKRAFENSEKTINEVMYEVGYSDMKGFRKMFRNLTGMSPIEYKNKYSRGRTLQQ